MFDFLDDIYYIEIICQQCGYVLKFFRKVIDLSREYNCPICKIKLNISKEQ